jgi:NADPH:quinone reductase-like Zn-dependent oxidoreductase
MVTRVVATAYGGPEVLAVVEVEPARPGPGEVLVDVRAAATNPIDYKLYSGIMGRDPGALPMPLGFEASGVVLEVGGTSEGPAGPIRAGDEVIAFRATGAYASHVVVPGWAAVPKPGRMSFEEASGLMLTGGTAVHALTVTDVGKGDTLLLHGASGGVGTMIVQLAVAAGVRVIGTGSDARHTHLRSLGALPVLYGDGLADRVRELATDGVDAAIDAAGTDEALAVSLALVADHSRIAVVANAGRAQGLGVKGLGMGPGADPGLDIRDAARLRLTRYADEGTIAVEVAARYPLSEAAQAHRELAVGHTHGKIVLIP